MESLSFRAHVMAVDRVEKRLRRVTAALDDVGIPYAVIDASMRSALPQELQTRLATIEASIEE